MSLLHKNVLTLLVICLWVLGRHIQTHTHQKMRLLVSNYNLLQSNFTMGYFDAQGQTVRKSQGLYPSASAVT